MANKNAKGRPTKLTAKAQEDITVRLRTGNTRTASVTSAGIEYQTFLNWLERGKADKSGIYFDFFEAVKKAEADAEVSRVAIISRAANDNWTAAAWWLERRNPADWGKKERVDVQQTNLNIDWDSLTEDELKRIAAGEHPAITLAARSQQAAS